MNVSCRPRFVILEHDHPFLHWDLLIEDDVELKSWRLLQMPALEIWIPAQRLPDHRPLYLDYEGPVSGDRGQVRRIHQGRFSCRFQLQSGTDHRYALQDCSFAQSASFRHSQAHFRIQLPDTMSANEQSDDRGSNLPVDGEWLFE